MHRASATVVHHPYNGIAFLISDGPYAGIAFSATREGARGMRNRIGETVRVKFSPDDQFAFEER